MRIATLSQPEAGAGPVELEQPARVGHRTVRAERQRGAVFEEFRDGLLEWLGHLLVARERLECQRPVTMRSAVPPCRICTSSMSMPRGRGCSRPTSTGPRCGRAGDNAAGAASPPLRLRPRRRPRNSPRKRRSIGEPAYDHLIQRSARPSMLRAKTMLPEHDLAPLDLEPAFAPLDAHVVVARNQQIAVLAPRRRRRGPLDRQLVCRPRPGAAWL